VTCPIFWEKVRSFDIAVREHSNELVSPVFRLLRELTEVLRRYAFQLGELSTGFVFGELCLSG
jgi:hypothetical protein